MVNESRDKLKNREESPENMILDNEYIRSSLRLQFVNMYDAQRVQNEIFHNIDRSLNSMSPPIKNTKYKGNVKNNVKKIYSKLNQSVDTGLDDSILSSTFFNSNTF